MSERSRSCAARLQEQERHAVSMKIVVKKSKRGNTVAMRKRLKTVSQRNGVDKTKKLLIPPCSVELH